MDYNEKYLKFKAKYLKLKSIMDKNNANKIVMSGGGSKTSKTSKTLYLFKAEWCPHCRMFKETWQNLETELKDKLKFVTYDSKVDSDKIESYGIKGYPTIILSVGNKAVEYVGPRDEQSLKEFINQYN